MQATIKLAGGSRLIQVDGETQKDLFEGMAMAYEVFNETTCGLCGSTNIRPVHRVADKYHFYEYQCQEESCRAKMSFGQSSENVGSMFPIRQLLPNGKPSWKDGTHGPHRGWTKYRGDNQQEDPPATVPRSNPQPKHTQHAGLPPEDPFNELKNMLYDIGVPQGESKLAATVVQFATQNNDDGPIAFNRCMKSPELSKVAIAWLNMAKITHGDGLLKKVQEWAGGKK